MDIVIELLYQIAHTDKHMSLVNGAQRGRKQEFRDQCANAVNILQAAQRAASADYFATTGPISIDGKMVELRIEG